MKKLLLSKRVVTGMMVCLLAGCTTQKDYDVDHVIYINYNSLSLYYGDKFQLTASPNTGSFEWSSDNNAIAKVSSTGEVEAVGVGETNITAIAGTVKKTIPVKISVPTVEKVTGKPGKGRAQIELTVQLERIKTIRITRMDTNQSMDVDINFKSGVFLTYYDGLSEGKYSFRIVCLDKYNMESEPINLDVQVYGDIYQSQIKPRTIKVTTAFGNGIAIAWNEAIGAFIDLYYKDINGKETKRRMSANSRPTYVFDYLPITEFDYVTVYLPEPAAVDTFFTSRVTVTLDKIGDKLARLRASNACVVRAGDFDLGGEGVGYHDTDNTNQGNNYAYRDNLGDLDSRGVDIEGGGNIGYTSTGEWLMYTVYVEDPGVYAMDFRVSVNNTPASCHFEVDGNVLPSYSMVSNGGWGDYRYYCERNAVNPPTSKLTKGFHKIKFYFETGNFNYDGLRFTFVSAE